MCPPWHFRGTNMKSYGNVCFNSAQFFLLAHSGEGSASHPARHKPLLVPEDPSAHGTIMLNSVLENSHCLRLFVGPCWRDPEVAIGLQSRLVDNNRPLERDRSPSNGVQTTPPIRHATNLLNQWGAVASIATCTSAAHNVERMP